jgi:hypothetical protein
MAKAHATWRVLPHGPIVKLAENLWWVSGDVPGMSLKRTMVVVRLADARLVIHSAIALDPSALGELEAWGKPAFLVVPNGYHRLDAPAYKQRYPDLRVFGPPGARLKIEEVVPLDGTLEDFPPNESVRFERLEGLGDVEWAMLVTSRDGLSVVLTDSVFHMDRKQDLLGHLFTTVLGSAPGPRVSRLTKLAMVKDRASFRGALERLASLPRLTRLIVGHEKVASGPEAARALRRAATYL